MYKNSYSFSKAMRAIWGSFLLFTEYFFFHSFTRSFVRSFIYSSHHCNGIAILKSKLFFCIVQAKLCVCVMRYLSSQTFSISANRVAVYFIICSSAFFFGFALFRVTEMKKKGNEKPKNGKN